MGDTLSIASLPTATPISSSTPSDGATAAPDAADPFAELLATLVSTAPAPTATALPTLADLASALPTDTAPPSTDDSTKDTDAKADDPLGAAITSGLTAVLALPPIVPPATPAAAAPPPPAVAASGEARAAAAKDATKAAAAVSTETHALLRKLLAQADTGASPIVAQDTIAADAAPPPRTPPAPDVTVRTGAASLATRPGDHAAPAPRAATRAVKIATVAHAPEIATPFAALLPADARVAAASPSLGTAAPADMIAQQQLTIAQDGQWLDSLARDIVKSADAGRDLHFQLVPPQLGSLTVSIAQNADGAAIRMTTDSDTTRTILVDAQPRLVAEARAQGLKISESHVDLSNSGGGSAWQQAGGQASGQQPGGQQPGGERRDPSSLPQPLSARTDADASDAALMRDAERYA